MGNDTSPEKSGQPFHEPLRATLARNGTIALVVGAIVAWRLGGIRRLPSTVLLALWPSLGGHFVEILFRNFLRPRLPTGRAALILVRLGVWFGGGVVLLLGMNLTAAALPASRAVHWPAWWIGGLAFIGIEGVVHLALQLRGLPSFYNGRG